jgi:PAS domain-containing protein
VTDAPISSRPGSFADDEVASFLRRSRALARETAERLQQLALKRQLSASRVATLATSPSYDSTSLTNELLARDEELTSAAQQLEQQIQALRKACALLERERSKYVDLFLNAPDAYVVTDLRGSTQDANIAAGTLLSVDAAFLRGRPLVAFVARNDTRAFRGLVRDLARAATPIGGGRSFTVRMRPRGQPVFLCHALVSAVSSAQGRPIALRWTLRRLDTPEAAAVE